MMEFYYITKLIEDKLIEILGGVTDDIVIALDSLGQPTRLDWLMFGVSIWVAIFTYCIYIKQLKLMQEQTIISKTQTEIANNQTEIANTQTRIMEQQNYIALFDKRYNMYCKSKEYFQIKQNIKTDVSKFIFNDTTNYFENCTYDNHFQNEFYLLFPDKTNNIFKEINNYCDLKIRCERSLDSYLNKLNKEQTIELKELLENEWHLEGEGYRSDVIYLNLCEESTKKIKEFSDNNEIYIGDKISYEHLNYCSINDDINNFNNLISSKLKEFYDAIEEEISLKYLN